MKSQLLVLSSLALAALTACGGGTEETPSSKLAADSSGCSPLLSSDYSVKTVQGFRLSASFEEPNSARCWNADRSQVVLSYSWNQENYYPAFNDIGFWVRIDGREEFLKAAASCSPLGTGGLFSCSATVYIQRWVGHLEVAPVRNGVWDTAGIGQNYHFQL
jgi:hypothetical protein